MVRDAFVEESSKMPIETIYGKGKADLVNAVQRKVQAAVLDIGLVVEKVYLVDDLILPGAVVDSINSKIKATQMAEQRQNEVAQSTAEANKKVAEAQGEAQSKLVVAEAEAKAIRLKADALKDSASLVQWQAVDKWDGKLPGVNGGGVLPFINIK
jgi:regulator of protease activity HflC (stomatin/prohibitin superfamily)